MYNFVGAAVIFSFMCMNRNWLYIDNYLDRLSMTSYIVDFFNFRSESCDQYNNKPVKEDFRDDNYRYEVSLPEFSGNFTVNIKYRAMLILAHERRLKQCDLTYYTVTTLPEYVDTSLATWSFEDGIFTVVIPAKKNLNGPNDMLHLGCYYDFSTDNIIVPRMTYLPPATAE